MKLHEPFGVCQNYPVRINPWHLAHDIETIRRMGVRWLRTEFDWRKIEPRKGEMNFQWYDSLVRICARKKINLVPSIIYSPRWVAPRFNIPPEDHTLFSRFVQRLVKRYCNYIKHWEIWNEADSYFFWIGDAKHYAGLLEGASIAAKDADPESKILMCGLADPARPNPAFIFDVLRNMDERCVDILNFHAYPGTWNERKIEDWPALLRDYTGKFEEIGIRKPVWVTETGLTSFENGSGREYAQASYLVRAFASLLGSGVVERVFWYRLKDETGRGEERFGLLDQRNLLGGWRLADRAYSKFARSLYPSVTGKSLLVNSPKPAHRAYTTLVQLLGQDFQRGTSSRFHYQDSSVTFLTPSQSVRIFWSEENGGRPRAIASSSGSIDLVPDSPHRPSFSSRFAEESFSESKATKLRESQIQNRDAPNSTVNG